jgi:ANTAR domain
MTITSSHAVLSATGVPADISPSTVSIPQPSPVNAGFDPVALIRDVTAKLIRSAEAEAVFGSLATAYAQHSAAHCTVELLTGSAVRVIHAPPPAAGGQVAGEQPSLSAAARQLLAGNGEPLVGADWFALPIGAPACQATDAEVPVGAFTCRFPDRGAGHPHLEPARLLLSWATELLQAERRLAKAHNQVTNLEIALNSNRDIGTAIGILMNAHLVTQDQAFSMLRTASQHSHRKLREIANEVIFTGSLGTTT